MVRSIITKYVHETENPTAKDKEIMSLEAAIAKLESSMEKIHKDQANGDIEFGAANKKEKKIQICLGTILKITCLTLILTTYPTCFRNTCETLSEKRSIEREERKAKLIESQAASAEAKTKEKDEIARELQLRTEATRETDSKIAKFKMTVSQSSMYVC